MYSDRYSVELMGPAFGHAANMINNRMCSFRLPVLTSRLYGMTDIWNRGQRYDLGVSLPTPGVVSASCRGEMGWYPVCKG